VARTPRPHRNEICPARCLTSCDDAPEGGGVPTRTADGERERRGEEREKSPSTGACWTRCKHGRGGDEGCRGQIQSLYDPQAASPPDRRQDAVKQTPREVSREFKLRLSPTLRLANVPARCGSGWLSRDSSTASGGAEGLRWLCSPHSLDVKICIVSCTLSSLAAVVSLWVAPHAPPAAGGGLSPTPRSHPWVGAPGPRHTLAVHRPTHRRAARVGDIACSTHCFSD
jgi:hypothetical protein